MSKNETTRKRSFSIGQYSYALIFIALFIPQGGEIYEPDFLFGYDVYVRPSYVFAEDAQLQTWKVTDRNTEKAL